MFNKNVFTQKDPLADLIKGINEADYKAKMEALKGNQHKIDKNKNNKVDADDFKILRGEKKVNEDQVEEAAESPFTSWKKPRQPEPSGGSGVKQGSRYGGSKQKDKPEHDDEKVKKEEIDPKKVTTDTLAGVVKGKTANPFAPKKVMLDVAGNVKEEAEDLEEAKFDALKHVKNPSPAVKAAAKDVKRGSYADRAALMKAGGVKDDRGPRGVTQEDVEEAKFDALKHVKNPSPAVKAAAKDVKRGSYADRAALMKAGGVKDDRGPRGVTQEDVEQVDERELSKGETSEKERIVKGMKKSLAGFKARYGDKAKSVMYATATKQAKEEVEHVVENWNEHSLPTLYHIHASLSHAPKHPNYKKELDAIERVVKDKHGDKELEQMKKHSAAAASKFHYTVKGGH